MIPIMMADFEYKIKQIQARTSFVNRPEVIEVRKIVEEIREGGNRALVKYISQFEYQTSLFAQIKITETEIDLAYSRIPPDMITIMQKAIKNVRQYHEHTVPQSWTQPIMGGSKYGMKVTPIRRVGVYVPGGSASYPSSVIMNVVPAQVAGVEQIVLASPSNSEGKVQDAILAVARELGVAEIYRMGGAQAIAALAYGTEDMDPVDKIVGPGNVYVTLAKKEVFGVVGIDKLAGPSDLCILADHLCNPKYVAADLLAQAEHDPLASVILITDSSDLAAKVQREIDSQLFAMKRKEIIEEVLQKNSAIFVLGNNSVPIMIDLVNLIAPEHLEVFHDSFKVLIQGIRNAGAIFVGEYSAEVLGDYNLGPNHVLPTGGTARYASVLSVADFVKQSSLIVMDKRDFPTVGVDAMRFAELEGLSAHANAIRVRL